MARDAAPTPMMAQYLELKRQAGGDLLFYRMGDFFELFFDDARTAAAVLDIALTARGEHQGEAIPMCGVPAHSMDAYLARLIKAGHRVAIADQTEDARAGAGTRRSKALVGRAIVRFVTAGTLTEDMLLDSRRANILAAVGEAGRRAGSGGGGHLDRAAGGDRAGGPCHRGRAGADRRKRSDRAAEPCRAHPRRPKNPDSGLRKPGLRQRPSRGGHLPPVRSRDTGQLRRVQPRRAVRAGGLIAYLDHVGQGRMPFLAAPMRAGSSDHLAIDPATRESLEIVQTMSGQRAGSLLATIDRTVTGAGARMLARRSLGAAHGPEPDRGPPSACRVAA